MRQLASRSKLSPGEVEAIWRNYTQTDKPATEIAATLGHAVEWHQSTDGTWSLMASAELTYSNGLADRIDREGTSDEDDLEESGLVNLIAGIHF